MKICKITIFNTREIKYMFKVVGRLVYQLCKFGRNLAQLDFMPYRITIFNVIIMAQIFQLSDWLNGVQLY